MWQIDFLMLRSLMAAGLAVLGVFTTPARAAAGEDFPTPAPAQRERWPAALTQPAPNNLTDLRAMERHVKALVARVSPAVVALEVSGGTGSGVVISRDGLVLTAGHVSGRSGREARLRFADGRTARGVTLGSVANTDTGLVRITDRGPWPFVPVGDLDSVVLGDWVLALGHPGGFDSERARVVRLGRLLRLGTDGLQSDCTISPGDSGGPLIDMQGRVIGIHSFISTAMTANFHVPISRFRQDWPRLIDPSATGRPAAYLGVTLAGDDERCEVVSVERNSPASRSGLRAGDVIVKVEERLVFNPPMLRRWLELYSPGDALTLEIERGGETRTITVKLAERPAGR